MFKPEIEGRTGHKYIALADAFAEAIESGELEAGSKLPPTKDFVIQNWCYSWHGHPSVSGVVKARFGGTKSWQWYLRKRS